ncbi:hypothetical protein PV326_007635 [Microctonus aethiopoides]|nr:hypothetical protein PV326_007635 [Microctonus aethiopoides]
MLNLVNIFYEPRSLDENFKKDEDEGYLKELTTESVEKQEPGDVQPGEQCKEFKICTFCKKPVSIYAMLTGLNHQEILDESDEIFTADNRARLSEENDDIFHDNNDKDDDEELNNFSDNDQDK